MSWFVWEIMKSTNQISVHYTAVVVRGDFPIARSNLGALRPMFTAATVRVDWRTRRLLDRDDHFEDGLGCVTLRITRLTLCSNFILLGHRYGGNQSHTCAINSFREWTMVKFWFVDIAMNVVHFLTGLTRAESAFCIPCVTRQDH